jgi:hypothetical protein
MSEHDNRHDFETRSKIDEMAEMIKDIRNILQGENGICVQLREVKTKGDSCQKELTEHKASHWQFSSVIIGVVGAVVAVFEWVRNK